MRQEDFVLRYEPEWRKLELWLDGRGAARCGQGSAQRQTSEKFSYHGKAL